MGMRYECGGTRARKRNQLVVGCRPGLYESEEGSVAIYPDQNITEETGSQYNGKPESCMVLDVDSGLTIIKKVAKLKGTYTFKHPLNAIKVSCTGPCATDL